ncbi:ATP-binding protein [Bosea sp. 117]|uniref:ATP-binding protein n=1 Tax=Bosea sp. 117 TaxID=1125973 RepID=UPI000691E6D1|nr:ATP-binding protein [Bosea sp. 117]
MSTLRAKLTVLLVAAVLLVVLLATGLSFLLLSPPRFQTAEDAAAAQIVLIADLLDRAPSSTEIAVDGFAGIARAPVGGPVAEEATRGLTAALARKGRTESVRVTHPSGASQPVISVQLSDGRWIILPFALMPPPDNSRALAGWAVLIALGTTGVMIFAVRRLTAPLALLERTVAAIGPDGELPPLPEQGPTEVRAAARAINLLSSRLKSAMESRIRIVAAAGHDLRTPMTRMRLRAEFLEDGERETWIADLDELDRIADSAIRLVREEVDASSRSPVRIDELVREVVAELKEIGMNVALGAARPLTVLGRPLALKRAIRNLTINAATHGREGRLRLDMENGRAVIRIEDRGPGIPEHMLARVFEPFFRIDPARGAPIPGAGLGLAIAREIIVNHGGSLALRNLPGGGLEQRLEFPLTGCEGGGDVSQTQLSSA